MGYQIRSSICAIYICLALLLVSSVSARADSASDLWLQAEAAKDPAIAVSKWKSFLAEVPKGETAGEGLSHELGQAQLFNTLLKLGAIKKDIKPIEEAHKISRNFELVKMVFADTEIAKTAIKFNKRFALRALKSAKSNSLSLKNTTQRNQALYGIALTAMTKGKENNKLLFSWDGPEIAEEVIPHITSSKQYAQLIQMLAPYQPEPSDKWGKKLYQLVTINKKSELEKRDKGLIELHKQAIKADKFTIAIDALSSVIDYSKQQEILTKWFKKTFDEKQYSRATMIAIRINDGKYAANAWGKLSEHHAKVGESVRAKETAQKAYEAALSTRREDRRMTALIDVASFASNSKNPAIAKQALESAGILKDDLISKNSSKSMGAISSYIKSLADNEQVETALSILKDVSFSDIKMATLSISAVSKALANSGEPDEALDLLNEQKLTPSKSLDRAYYAISKAFTKNKDFEKALEISTQINDKSERLKAETYIKKKKAKSDSSQKGETSALEAPFFSSLIKQINSLPKDVQEQSALDIAESLIGEPNLPIDKIEELLTTAKGKDQMIAVRSLHLAKLGKVAEASRLMRTMRDTMGRVRNFRKLATELSLQTDSFGFLGSDPDPIIEQTRQNMLSASDETQLDSKTIEAKFSKILDTKEAGVEMASPKASNLGLEIPEFDFPERLEFNYEYVKASLPTLTPFKLDRVYYENSFFINTKFRLAIAYSENNLKYGNISPEVLHLSSGTTTLPLLYDYLKSNGLEGYITKLGNEYTLNVGIMVAPGATLIIDGEEVSRLYQSKQASSILVNAGNLYITGTSIIGWDMEKQAPAFTTSKDQYSFRPFIAGWSRSHTYLAGSEFIALGYSNHKSYGISFSAGPEKLQQNTITEPTRPDGIIVDNNFNNVYYGFYSYEADNVSLIGNEYEDNIIYGIDPHDRSRWLTIAYNTAYNAEKKHGIIISREVNDSSFVGNLSFDNKGSGFMIDRLSNGTFTYGNTAFGNKQDGLTIFESHCNFIASNRFFKNKSLGLRVRNSIDNGVFFNSLYKNKQAGATIYTSELLDDIAHKNRNFKLDPYSDIATASLVGNLIEDNGTGIIGNNMSALILRGNRFVDQSPKMFGGDWFTEHSYFASQYDISNKGVFMGEKCPKGKIIPSPCRFRKDGFYDGDAQSELEQRIASSSCQTVSKQDVKH